MSHPPEIPEELTNLRLKVNECRTAMLALGRKAQMIRQRRLNQTLREARTHLNHLQNSLWPEDD